MSPVVLGGMTPIQEQGWEVLLDLAADFPTGWCLVGGQLVWLLALEDGAVPPRSTEDIDVVVDVRVSPDGIRRLCTWLELRAFSLEGINAHGIGHRYLRTATGRGNVTLDVLAPDNLSARTDLTTTPPARTLSAPGTRSALNSAERVEVLLGARTGSVLRPTLLGAILAKTAATTIATRGSPERDWADIAFLLSLVADPIAMAAELTAGQLRRLRTTSALLDEAHWAWRSLGPRAALGQTTLQFLLDR